MKNLFLMSYKNSKKLIQEDKLKKYLFKILKIREIKVYQRINVLLLFNRIVLRKNKLKAWLLSHLSDWLQKEGHDYQNKIKARIKRHLSNKSLMILCPIQRLISKNLSLKLLKISLLRSKNNRQYQNSIL